MFFGYRLKLLTLKNIQSATAVSELGVVVMTNSIFKQFDSPISMYTVSDSFGVLSF
jgi:hypothetical protein